MVITLCAQTKRGVKKRSICKAQTHVRRFPVSAASLTVVDPYKEFRAGWQRLPGATPLPAPPIQRSPGGVAYAPWFQVLAKTRGARSSPAQRLPEVKGECSTQCLPAAEEDSPHGNVSPRLEGTPPVPSEVALPPMPPESRRAHTERSVEVLKSHVEYSGDRKVRILDMQ